MVLNLARNPASCWSSSGVMASTLPAWAKVGYSGCRAKIQTTDRKLGTTDCTIR